MGKPSINRPFSVAVPPATPPHKFQFRTLQPYCLSAPTSDPPDRIDRGWETIVTQKKSWGNPGFPSSSCGQLLSGKRLDVENQALFNQFSWGNHWVLHIYDRTDRRTVCYGKNILFYSIIFLSEMVILHTHPEYMDIIIWKSCG